MNYKELIISHYEKNWGRNYFVRQWHGKMNKSYEDFCILEFEPTENRKMWTYATCGMASSKSNPIELHIFSKEKDDDIIELLTAIGFYHLDEQKLDLNHTINFGKPWQSNSFCTYGLVSLPYLDGPQLEVLTISNELELHFYWLLPITPQELKFKKEKGIEELEQHFEESNFDYSDPMRLSMV